MSLISAQFYNMPGRYERVCVGWHCAKVKGHAELKIEKSRVKTFIYDFPKLHHCIPNSFGGNVHLRQIFFNTSYTNVMKASYICCNIPGILEPDSVGTNVYDRLPHI